MMNTEIFPGGITVANRKRYKEIERILTQVLLADTAVFVLFLVFSATGLLALKVITAIVAILASLLCLGFLYMSGELRKRRSLWLVVAFLSIIVCLLVSLILKYPAPAAAAVPGPTAPPTLPTVG